MSRANHGLRKFAMRLIEYEARGSKLCKPATVDVFDVCEKLRPPLAMLMGNGGFRGLIGRARALASAEVPWLRSLKVNSEGTVTGLVEIQPPVSMDALSAGRIELLAQMLGLLVAFIGENLTLRLVREVWPKTPLLDLETFNEEKNAKAI